MNGHSVVFGQLVQILSWDISLGFYKTGFSRIRVEISTYVTIFK